MSEAKKLKKNRAAGIIFNMNSIDYKFFLNILVIFSLFHFNSLYSKEILPNLRIEEGFQIEIFIKDIDTPRQIAESDDGTIFVGSRSGGKITAIDRNKNIRIIAKDLSNATGVTYHKGDL